jgi:WD40 repeat protein
LPKYAATQPQKAQTAPIPEIAQLLTQAKQGQEKPWFRPLTANLTPPGGPLLRTLTGHNDSVRAVALSADGQIAVSGSEDEPLKVWDLARGRELHSLTGHNNSVNAVALQRRWPNRRFWFR